MVILSVSACSSNPVTGEQNLVLFSEQQELALGQQAHRQTLQQYPVYNDPALQQYVDAVGQRLAEHSHRPDLRYTFTLLDSTEINAFALPGGFIYITRGLLAYLNSEAELAAVLGHELGHVTARHGVRQASSAQVANIGSGLLSIFVPELRASGADQAVALLGTALVRGYGREHELEADRLGSGYLAASGYDPTAMIDVVRTLKNHELLDHKLAAREGRQARAYHGVFATHPDNDTRLQAIVANTIHEAGGGERQRDRFLDQIDGLIFGDNPGDGVFIDDRFVHPTLGFSFEVPARWLGENLPDKLVLGDPARKAVMLIRLAPPSATATTPAAVLREAGLQTLARSETVQPGGLPGITGLAQVNLGGAIRPARVAAVIKDGYGFIFTGVAADAGLLGAFDPTFQKLIGSFRPLADADKAGFEPQRIAVVRPRAAVSWAALAAASPVEILAEDQLRLLNAAQGTDATPENRIKIIK